ncbi:MAG TPA: FAD-dependent oxidoreductase [Solirubrobacteraceae bacterium]|nr:FAD-dependent oxidoreductase [Solirubrobacteraceae bacterium]
MNDSADVVVVGGGPAGLSAAIALREMGVGRVVVLERERRAGGVPRHCDHQGFGARDLHRLLGGPAYAARLAALAAAAGVQVAVETMATDWGSHEREFLATAPGSPERELLATGPAGRRVLRARAILLACGCRERPRSARLVAGSRPEGVMTTGTLQQLVHLERRPPGRRALIVGAEHVSYSAIATLRQAGCAVAGMVTELERHQSLGLFAAGARALGVPLWTRTRVAAIRGRARVELVELQNLATGETRALRCDTVIFTADWIPDHELAVRAGVDLDAGTRGPAVDQQLRTGTPMVWAAGNLVHGAEPADVAALAGRHAARSIACALAGAPAPRRTLAVCCEPPLGWISPSRIAPGGGLPPRDCFLLRSSAFLTRPRVVIEQGGRSLWRGRPARLQPGRSARIPAGWIELVDFGGAPVRVRLA